MQYVAFCFPNKAVAQLSASDSLLFSSLFKYPLYTTDSGRYYLHDTCKDVASMYQLLFQSLPYEQGDFNKVYSQIHVNDSLQPIQSINETFNHLYEQDSLANYRQRNPLFALPFTLHNIPSKAITTLTSCGNGNENNKVAILIVPGSGENPTSDIHKNQGYQCLYCDLKKLLSTYADVYVQVKPLQDCRAIYWNHHKLEAEITQDGQPMYIIPYKSTQQHRYGTNILIETTAMIKYLQQHYDRVLVAGLSHGGYIAYFASILSSPNALLYAGGLGYDANEWEYEQKYFGDIMNLFLPDQMLDSMKNTSTQFLFSVAEVDNFYNIPPAFLGYDYIEFDLSKKEHSFPYCNVWYDWIQHQLHVPSVRIDSILLKNNQAWLQVSLKGKPPFQTELFRNNQQIKVITIDSNHAVIPIVYNGRYQLRSCTDQLQDGIARSNVFQVSQLLNITDTAQTNNQHSATKHLFLYQLDGTLVAQEEVDADRRPLLQAQARVNLLAPSIYFYVLIDHNQVLEKGTLVPLFH